MKHLGLLEYGIIKIVKLLHIDINQKLYVLK